MACGNGSLLHADKMSCAYDADPVNPEVKSRAVALTDLEGCQNMVNHTRDPDMPLTSIRNRTQGRQSQVFPDVLPPSYPA